MIKFDINLIEPAMKEIGFTRTFKCCEVTDKFCNSDTYKGELRAYSSVLIRMHNEKAKPFAAPGSWFPTGVLGHPMREVSKGKWESAIWPSEQMDDVARTDLIDDSDGENRPIRSFLAAYGAPITIGQMRDHLEMSGWDKLWPQWVNDLPDGTHLTKSGAQSWLRYLFELEANHG